MRKQVDRAKREPLSNSRQSASARELRRAHFCSGWHRRHRLSGGAGTHRARTRIGSPWRDRTNQRQSSANAAPRRSPAISYRRNGGRHRCHRSMQSFMRPAISIATWRRSIVICSTYCCPRLATTDQSPLHHHRRLLAIRSDRGRLATEVAPFRPLPAFAWMVPHLERNPASPEVDASSSIRRWSMRPKAAACFDVSPMEAIERGSVRVAGSEDVRWPLVHSEDLAKAVCTRNRTRAAGIELHRAAIEGFPVGRIPAPSPRGAAPDTLSRRSSLQTKLQPNSANGPRLCA